MKLHLSPDVRAVALLIALWLFFFWRLLTPVEADQASLKQGDFSGQFVAFAGYQYARFAAGEIPLWNPYNNGGLPFIADTQAAVFYPPRLITLLFARLSGGWSYHALELEMTAHVLAYTLAMYTLVRRMTLGQRGSVAGGLAAALAGGYGGFLSGYPPLQLALLEAAVWLPLCILGLYEATRTPHIRWRWLTISGLALGLSWMAGHPQTSYFLTLLLVVYWAYRVWSRHSSVRRWWPRWLGGTLLLALISFGIAAVQLLPGIEYLAHTARPDLTFDVKGNGFPFQDIAQFIFPGVVSLFSPLYIGFMALMLALIALWRRTPQAAFWGVIALLALLWSFGSSGALYPLLYNLLPGLRFFRGQERAAFLVANSLAILCGLGMQALVSAALEESTRALLRRWMTRLSTAVVVIAAVVFMLWIGAPDAYGVAMPRIAFGALMVVIAALVLTIFSHETRRRFLAPVALVVIVFELFSVNMNAASNYDPVPPSRQVSMQPPPLVQTVLDDPDIPFRVDGFRGLHDNFGSLYGVADMRGISPLFLRGPFALVEGDMPDEKAWELFAVRYVYTDWRELPVPSEIIATGSDRWGPINLHRLTDPRPFAQIMFDIRPVSGDTEAHELLRTNSIDPRRTLLIEGQLPIEPRESEPIPAAVIEFAPERIVITYRSAQPGVLSLSLPHYPGWVAAVDGTPAPLFRAYGALSAVEAPAGEHTVTLTFDPLSYRIGAWISLFTWIGCCILLPVTFIRASRDHAGS